MKVLFLPTRADLSPESFDQAEEILMAAGDRTQVLMTTIEQMSDELADHLRKHEGFLMVSFLPVEAAKRPDMWLLSGAEYCVVNDVAEFRDANCWYKACPTPTACQSRGCLSPSTKPLPSPI
jgi:hypothetical protein